MLDFDFGNQWMIQGISKGNEAVRESMTNPNHGKI